MFTLSLCRKKLSIKKNKQKKREKEKERERISNHFNSTTFIYINVVELK